MRATCLKMLPLAAALLAAVPASAQLSAKMTATAADLQAKWGTSKVKVVFACQGALYFIDYSEATPAIRKMNGTGVAYYPTISPDGKMITYQTGNDKEGVDVSSNVGKVFARGLAETAPVSLVASPGYVPRFVLSAPADAPEIVYSTSLACPGGLCYSGGSTLKKALSGTSWGAAQTVFGTGSYFGGLSWDNRYLMTAWEGGPNSFMLDLAEGGGKPHETHTIKVKKDGTEADTSVVLGACNPSRSASRVFTSAMLYFDFGSAALKKAKTHHPLLGSWDPHQKLFVSSYGSEDLKVYDMPADRKLVPSADAVGIGEATAKKWDHPEWSNHPYYAVATLVINRLFKEGTAFKTVTKAESIYLINLKDSSYVKVVESTDTSMATTVHLETPYLWVDVPTDFQEDATWLSKTIWGTTAGVRPFERGSRFNGNLFALDKDVTGLKVYSALGAKLMTIDATVKTSAEVAGIFQGFRPGIYFVGLEARGQKPRVIQWLKTE